VIVSESYIVKANDHHCRRNRRDILKTQEAALHNDLSSEVAENTNCGDPVAEKLADVPREEFDKELTSATSLIIRRVNRHVIRALLRYRGRLHCSEWHGTLNIY